MPWCVSPYQMLLKHAKVNQIIAVHVLMNLLFMQQGRVSVIYFCRD